MHAGRSATATGILALLICVTAFATAPLLLIPYIGFVSALLAAVGIVVVADPAIRDYDELHEVIDYNKSLVFGS